MTVIQTITECVEALEQYAANPPIRDDQVEAVLGPVVTRLAAVTGQITNPRPPTEEEHNGESDPNNPQ